VQGLALHLDGARLANAAVQKGVPLGEIAGQFDSVSFCLSKGLGAPVGSLLCGSREFIATARRWRKMLGGGMRQAGVLAAAGLVALDDGIDRLAEDHANARRLAEGLAQIPELAVDPARVETNMVFCCTAPDRAEALAAFLQQRAILIAGRESIRLVTHRDVTAADIERVVAACAEFFRAD
jgi:threonine aldolase